MAHKRDAPSDSTPDIVQPVAKRTRGQTQQAAKDTFRNDIYKRNAASSPLLRLPPELRKIIYGYVLGGHLVCLQTEGYYHFRDEDAHAAAAKHKNSIALNHFVCNCRDSSTACGKWLEQSSAWMWSRYFNERTPDCFRNKLNTDLLRTCWSVYQDARLIPFSFNCFSFCHGVAFVRFVLVEIGVCQRQALRELHLRSTLGCRQGMWETVLDPKVLPQLSGLRRVSITMDRHPLLAHRGPDVWKEDQWVQGFVSLQRLPPSDVTVTVWKPKWNVDNGVATLEELTTDEVRAYTRRLQERILAQPIGKTT